MPHKPGVGAIFGITSEDGVAAQKRVVLMDRSSLKIVAKTTADEDGAYAFTGLNPDTNDYLVFAVDDDGAPAKDALIRDYITPIPAYSGATYIGNWTKRVLADYPVAGWLGQFDASGNPIHVADATYDKMGGTTTYAVSGITPGASHLGAIQLEGAAFGVKARRDMERAYANPLKTSMEWVFLRSSATTARQPTLCSFATVFSLDTYNSLTAENGVSLRLIAAIRYLPATAELVAYNISGANSNNQSPWDLWREIARFTLPEGTPDAVHVVLTVEYAYLAKLYVNGALVTTASLAGQNAFITGYGGSTQKAPLGMAVVGQTTDVNSVVLGRFTTVLTGPFAMYLGKILTDAEALARYQALMLGTAPTETGYAKEVLIDQPMYYYRLNESDHTNGFADWVTTNEPLRTATVVSGDLISYNQPSAVMGQTGMVFAGGAARTNLGPGASSSRSELSFECIFSLTAAPTGTQWLVGNSDDAEAVMSGLFLDANSKLNLRTRESAANTTVLFANTTFTPDVMRHVVVTLNKALLQAKLYIDGELVETVSTTGTLLDAPHVFAGFWRETHIAGVVNDAFSTVTAAYRGYLSDVAFYSQALSDSRIAAHYAALQIA